VKTSCGSLTTERERDDPTERQLCQAMKIAGYDTDLTDAQWTQVEPMLPPPQHLGRPRTDLRRIWREAAGTKRQTWTFQQDVGSRRSCCPKVVQPFPTSQCCRSSSIRAKVPGGIRFRTWGWLSQIRTKSASSFARLLDRREESVAAQSFP